MTLLAEPLTTGLLQLFPDGVGERLFVVGGTVRDAFLHKPQRDVDLVAALTDETLVSCGFSRIVGKTTTPIWFRSHPGLGAIEVTQLPDPLLIEEELKRRDFTINAMAVSLAGRLYDPLQGYTDLLTRNLQVCSADSFSNDPLRLFRALRFEAEGWRPTATTEQLLGAKDWSEHLAAIPAERFSRELLKALAAEQPTRFFERMLHLNIGRHWLPELFAMSGVPAGPPEHHPEGDLCSHSLQVLQRAAQLTPDPLTRFCAMFHDLGKLRTDPAAYPYHHGHDQAGVEPAAELCNRLRLPARYRTALCAVNRLHTTINRWAELRDATRLRLAEQACRSGIAETLALVSRADTSTNTSPCDWNLALNVSQVPAAGLGLDQAQVDALQPEQRSCLIVDRRIQLLRKRRQTSMSPHDDLSQ